LKLEARSSKLEGGGGREFEARSLKLEGGGGGRELEAVSVRKRGITVKNARVPGHLRLVKILVKVGRKFEQERYNIYTTEDREGFSQRNPKRGMQSVRTQSYFLAIQKLELQTISFLFLNCDYPNACDDLKKY
jgi:hypothetical protein